MVKRIFLLANDGKSPRAIAELLTEEKILIPAAHAERYHKEQSNGQKYSDPYLWGVSTVRKILDRQEYLGHTILSKSVGTNFKLHKRKETSAEDHYYRKRICEVCGREYWPNNSQQKFLFRGMPEEAP